MQLSMGFQPIYLWCGIAVLGAILAFSRGDTLWGTIIKLFNTFFASMVALNFFEPVANMFDGFMGVMAYYNDMLAFFLLFAITMEILVEITNRISKVNVYLPDKANLIGTYAVLFVMFLGFYLIPVFVFTQTLPEAPLPAPTSVKEYGPFKSTGLVNLLDFESKGALKPFAKGHTWNTKEFMKNQYRRNCGVYDKVDASKDSSTWKFEGESPNK